MKPKFSGMRAISYMNATIHVETKVNNELEGYVLWLVLTHDIMVSVSACSAVDVFHEAEGVSIAIHKGEGVAAWTDGQQLHTH